MPSTIKLHRVFKTTPERLYKAFLDPEAMVKWLPPHGFTAKVHSMDARVGASPDLAVALVEGLAGSEGASNVGATQ